MGYADSDEQSALEAFLGDFRKTELNRKILDHLLHDAFSDDRQTQAEVDLVFDPDPPEERIAEVLGRYPFRDVRQAYRNLMSLGEEPIRFLSTRRCRHFLAAIAPQLLSAIAETADPDSTLVNLDDGEQLSGRQGRAMGIVQFQPAQPAALRRALRYSPYLSGILTSNPGHDRRPDGQPRPRQAAHASESMATKPWPSCAAPPKISTRSCKVSRTTSSFASAYRDILGKEDVQATTGTCRTSPKLAWRKLPLANTSGLRPASVSRMVPIVVRLIVLLTLRVRTLGHAERDKHHVAALRNGHPGAGEVRRPRDELP